MVARMREIVQKDANAFKAELLCTALCHCAAGAVRPRMNNGMSDAAYEQICTFAHRLDQLQHPYEFVFRFLKGV